MTDSCEMRYNSKLDALHKEAKVYIKSDKDYADARKRGARVRQGPKGGLYYDTDDTPQKRKSDQRAYRKKLDDLSKSAPPSNYLKSNKISLNDVQEPVFKDFLKDINYSSAKKEEKYMVLDGKLVKSKGTGSKVAGTTVFDEFNHNDIQTIHNHPLERPPSDVDVFVFLYSGAHTSDAVITPSGKLYVMKRTPETRKLSTISRQRVQELGETDSVINQLNSDKRREYRQFSQLVRIYADQIKEEMNITSNEESASKQDEMQQRLLERLAENFGFTLEVSQLQ